MGFRPADRTVVCELAKEVAEIAERPVHDQKRAMWTRLKCLNGVRPMVWINEPPWSEKAVEAVGQDYVFSHRASPSVLAWDVWDPDQACRELRTALERMHGCVVEIIMKDVTSCRVDPRRLWESCDLAVQVAEEYA